MAQGDAALRRAVDQLGGSLEAISDGITMDSAEEIFVNTICTLVERSEIRDLVDVMLLERRGFKVEARLLVLARQAPH